MLDAPRRFLFAGIGDPYLRDDKDVFTWNTGLANGIAYALFITIGLCGVDEAITYLKRVTCTPFCLLRRNLKESVAQERHLNTIVQSNRLHIDGCILAI